MSSDLKVTNIKHESSSSNNLVLASDGSASFPSTTIGGLQSMQVFDDPSANGTATNTWTKPSGIRSIKVYVTGGGGGSTSGPTNDNSGSTGGGGGTAIKIIDVSSVSSVSVTVGAGGAGTTTSAGTNAVADDGDTSHFGSYCSANGGKGGNLNNDYRFGGAGGTATGGDLNLTGGSGAVGGTDGSNNPNPPGNQGGSSFWAGAGGTEATLANGDTRLNGVNGCGGGNRSQYEVGGNGGDGLVVVEEYI